MSPGAELVYDPKKGLGMMDRILMRAAAAHKSPKELSAAVNGKLSPAAAWARVEEISDSRDVYTDAISRSLLIDELMELKDHLKTQVYEFHKSDQIKPLISLLGQIDKTLSTQQFDLKAAMEQLTRAHATIVLSAFSLGLERSFLELEKRYPEFQRAELDEIFQEAMPDVVLEIESRVPVPA